MRANGESAEGEVVTVCAQGGLRMRKKPNGRYMKMILDGTRLVVLEEKGGWLRVEYRGYTGWVSKWRYCCKAGGLKNPRFHAWAHKRARMRFSGQKTHPGQNRRRLEVQRRFCLPDYA